MTGTKIKINSIDKNYADALMKVWHEEGVPPGYILNTLEVIKTLLDENPQLKTVLTNPSVSSKIKYEIAEEVYKIIKEPHGVNFTKILIEKNRLNELDGIIAEFKRRVDEANNFRHAEVTSAIELDDKTKTKILDKLEKKLRKKLFIDWQVDPQIIGGLVINIEEDVLDISLKKKLEDLSKNLLK